MSKHAKHLIKARELAPDTIRGLDFDAWLLQLILAALEPCQRELVEWLLVGDSDEPLCTSDYCALVGTTPERAGLTFSRLRRLGLITTTYRLGDDNLRRAYHIVVEWARKASAWEVQQCREAWDNIFRTVGGRLR